MQNINTNLPPLKLVCLNIEKDKHLGRVLPFLAEEAPDVICLQEIFESDLPIFENTLKMHGYFAPMTLVPRDENGKLQVQGVAMLSAKPLHNVQEDYYGTCGRKPGELVPFKDWKTTVQKVLLSGVIKLDQHQIRVGTTHFTWSPGGQADDNQREDLNALEFVLSRYQDLIFCGDFNAPRGGEIYDALSRRYKTAIPPEVTTTLDQNLHRTKGLRYVVDEIFSTDEYGLANVRVVDGVSDHCALIADIALAKQQALHATKHFAE